MKEIIGSMLYVNDKKMGEITSVCTLLQNNKPFRYELYVSKPRKKKIDLGFELKEE